jgi:IclR family mhp operon transcriptional activator
MANGYSVRALTRGLDLLAALNARGSATLAELSAATGLPRPTAFRLLRTLCEQDFVCRDVDSDRYRPAARVTSLSSGFEEDAWLFEHAREPLERLGDELVWPLSLTTLAGTRVLVRSNTDSKSPLTVRRLTPGMTLPVLRSASGKVMLAFIPERDREPILRSLRRSDAPDDLDARDEKRVAALLGEIRDLGFASQVVARRVADLRTVAVPVLVRDRAVSALAVRFAVTAVSENEVRDLFLPALRRSAAEIGSGIEQDSRAARVFGAA